MHTYKLTLIAILATLAVIGRYWFAFLPNVQPVTAIIIIAGVILGPVSALLLTVIVVLVSNLLLGMGIWTIWQMISWGAIGVISGWIGKFFPRTPFLFLVIFSIFTGYFYGFIISLTTYQITGSFWPYYLSGLPFDTYHATGNAVFMLMFYPLITYLIKKYASYRFPINNND